MRRWGSRPARNGSRSRRSASIRTAFRDFLANVPFVQEGPRRLKAARIPGPGIAAGTPCPRHVDPAGVWPDPLRFRQERRSACRPHRHHVARRDGLDQPRRLREPARALRQGRRRRPVPQGAHSVDLRLGILAQGPAHRARHRREQSLHPSVGARSCAFDRRRAADPDRHALRSLHLSRRRCAELRLLSERPLHPGGDAVRHLARAGRRRAPVDRHAARRHGAGRAVGLRAGLCRRGRGDPALGVRLSAARGRGRSGRADLAPRRDRRLGLSAPFHAADRAGQARHVASPSPPTS